MKKNLPDFSVTGTLDELVRAEMLLVMIGYDDPNEKRMIAFWDNFNQPLYERIKRGETTTPKQPVSRDYSTLWWALFAAGLMTALWWVG